MNVQKLKLKIGTKLFIGFAVIAVVFMLVQWYAVNFMRSYSSQQLKTLLTEKADTATIQINNFFNQLDSYNAGLIDIYNESTSSAKLTTAGRFIIQNNSYVKKITFLKPSGREIIKIEKDISNTDNLFFEIGSDVFDDAVAGKTAISKVFFLDDEPGPFINIFTPIKSGRTVVAIIKMQISLIKLWDVISQIKLGTSGFAYVVDNDGRLIAHPNINSVLKSPILRSRKVVDASLKSFRVLFWPDDYEYTNEQKVNVISQISIVKRVGWVVVFEQSTSEAYQFMNFLLSFFTYSLVLAITFIVIISYILSQNILFSIRKLKQGTLVLEEGNLKSQINLNSGDEFEDLSRAFNSMAVKLDHSFSQIEEQQRQANKTAQLLLKRDLDLRTINDELEIEKDNIKVEKDKFMVVLSGITDAVIALDLDYRIVTFNAAAEKLTGFTAAEAIGIPIKSIMTIYDKDHEVKPTEYCPPDAPQIDGIIFSKNFLKLVGRGKQSFVNIVAGRIADSRKNNLAGIVSIHDLTEEQRLEEMKLDFVSMAAHELRTPLTSIRGYLALFMEENKAALRDDQKFLLTRVDISCQQLGSLVENLLSVSRIEKGAFAVNLKPLDWTDLLKNTFDQLTVRAQEKNLTYTFDEPKQAIMVLADKIRIAEVVTNLIANAISYTPAKGSIRVYVESNNKEVITHIQDTGEGIAAEALPHLFTKFFRVSGVLSQGSKGTGLGLYISKAIVEKHNGKIWVESVVNKGSTFSFSLPLYIETEKK